MITGNPAAINDLFERLQADLEEERRAKRRLVATNRELVRRLRRTVVYAPPAQAAADLLSGATVARMKRLSAMGKPISEIAMEFGTSPDVVKLIVPPKVWSTS